MLNSSNQPTGAANQLYIQVPATMYIRQLYAGSWHFGVSIEGRETEQFVFYVQCTSIFETYISSFESKRKAKGKKIIFKTVKRNIFFLCTYVRLKNNCNKKMADVANEGTWELLKANTFSSFIIICKGNKWNQRHQPTISFYKVPFTILHHSS